jgi:hypothetical protein
MFIEDSKAVQYPASQVVIVSNRGFKQRGYVGGVLTARRNQGFQYIAGCDETNGPCLVNNGKTHNEHGEWKSSLLRGRTGN